jgi:hypothetical protein
MAAPKISPRPRRPKSISPCGKPTRSQSCSGPFPILASPMWSCSLLRGDYRGHMEHSDLMEKPANSLAIATVDVKPSSNLLGEEHPSMLKSQMPDLVLRRYSTRNTSPGALQRLLSRHTASRLPVHGACRAFETQRTGPRGNNGDQISAENNAPQAWLKSAPLVAGVGRSVASDNG